MGQDTLEHVVALGLVVWDSKLGACGTSGSGGVCAVLSAQAAVFHNDNCMILCSKICKVSVMAAMGVGVEPSGPEARDQS